MHRLWGFRVSGNPREKAVPKDGFFSRTPKGVGRNRVRPRGKAFPLKVPQRQ
jgi:hypothetical protein